MYNEYKLSYGSAFNFILTQIIRFNCHGSIYIFSMCWLYVIESKIEEIFSGYQVIITIIRTVAISVGVVWAIYLLVIFFFPKKAVLNSSFVKVKKYTLHPNFPNRGFNDEIFMPDII